MRTALADFDAMVDANLVGDGSSAGTDTGTDDRSFWTTHETSYDCSADG